MRFTRFGVTLERLERRHVQLVRRWRNSAWVRPFMRHQAFIHADEQWRWFERLDPRRDWYFVTHIRESPFALFYVKGVDWTRRCGEAGGFVGSRGAIGGPEPAQATLALMDFAFLVLRLQSLEAAYRVALPRVVRFNHQLGYRVVREGHDGFLRARVTAARYFSSAAAFRRAATALHGSGAALAGPDDWLARHLDRRRAPRRAGFELQLR
jgi:hypothetical protein